MENLRIRFVGFFHDETNYIVDLDMREVSYKAITCSTYRKLESKITTFTNPINSSLTLSFQTVDKKFTVEIEVYPNCIKHCTVSLLDNVTHIKTILEKEYYNFDYFTSANLLDKNGNIFTFVDYNDVFNLTSEQLLDMFSHEECASILYKTITNIECQKNFSIIIKSFLEDIKKRIDYPTPLEKEE